MYIYIYIYIEREREKNKNTSMRNTDGTFEHTVLYTY